MITFIETKLFSRLVEEYLSDDSYRQLQAALASDPEAGPLIPGSGGLRKLRWGISGRGKRGGLRVIYYARIEQDEIWLLTLYAKNVAENIPSHVLRQIKKEIDDEKDKSS
jgi:mRNA-degrading endonuclease RelE of RelBE toxin-antitoxin system